MLYVTYHFYTFAMQLIYVSTHPPWKTPDCSGQDFQGGFQIAAKRIGMLESFRAGTFWECRGGPGVRNSHGETTRRETFDQHFEKIV